MIQVFFHIGKVILLFELVLASHPLNSSEVSGPVKIFRRILEGQNTKDTRPYMVYLRPATTADPSLKDDNWLCGGVIIHKQFILTSAACIDNVKEFYVVSGTHKWMKARDECIRLGAKKAIWKCTSEDYQYDGEDFDNILWMINDIAVVKVEDEFNFEKRVKGCDFIPQMINYNNKSDTLEKPGTQASLAGWGSTGSYVDVTNRAVNIPELLETETQIITHKMCMQAWPERYHFIIKNMICSKAHQDRGTCADEGVKCKELMFSKGAEVTVRALKYIKSDDKIRRSNNGGFCENDHGGPLIVGQGKASIVIGIISATLINDKRQCTGPFLYTSVWNHRNLIACALGYSSSETCRRMLKQGHTFENSYNMSKNNTVSSASKFSGQKNGGNSTKRWYHEFGT